MTLAKQLELFVAEAIEGCLTLGEVERETRRQYIVQMLMVKGGNQCRAARELGMHRNTLGRNITELRINTVAIREQLAEQKKAARAVARAPHNERMA